MVLLGEKIESEEFFMIVNFSVAIDGPAGAGKSSVAGEISKRFKIFHLNTGALYRSVAFYFLKNNDGCVEDLKLEKEIEKCKLKVRFFNNKQQVFVNGKRVDEKIMGSEVAKAASFISQNFSVREHILKIEREFSKNNGVVMDGRDIGTVVLPNADVKIFLTASLKIRAFRRFEELKLKGFDVNFSDILKDIEMRDLNDVNRKIAPLKIAKDAVVIDSGDLTLSQTVDGVADVIYKFILKEQRN